MRAKTGISFLLLAVFLHATAVFAAPPAPSERLTMDLTEEEIAKIGRELNQSVYVNRVKPILDKAVVLLTAPLTLPLSAIVAATIKLMDGGPVIFRQPRVGKDGKLFTVLKFRSMTSVPARDGELTGKTDARVSKLGKALRMLHLDELPQLWNIFRGDMSLVGPRPLMASWEAELRKQIDGYHFRHLITPGLTGKAQLEVGYTTTVEGEHKKAIADLGYVKKVTFWGDVKLLCRTALDVIGRKGR